MHIGPIKLADTVESLFNVLHSITADASVCKLYNQSSLVAGLWNGEIRIRITSRTGSDEKRLGLCARLLPREQCRSKFRNLHRMFWLSGLKRTTWYVWLLELKSTHGMF